MVLFNVYTINQLLLNSNFSKINQSIFFISRLWSEFAFDNKIRAISIDALSTFQVIIIPLLFLSTTGKLVQFNWCAFIWALMEYADDRALDLPMKTWLLVILPALISITIFILEHCKVRRVCNQLTLYNYLLLFVCVELTLWKEFSVIISYESNCS